LRPSRPLRSTPNLDFHRTPFTVIWELTRACDLCCRHCRADARPDRDPRELTTAEGFELLEQVRELAPPVFVVTGGDPLKRPDLFALLERATALGLPVAVTPSGTPLLTRDVLARMRDLGVGRIAMSLDGPSASVHNGFRQQEGSFAATVAGIRYATALGLAVQINTTVTRHALALLDDLGAVVGNLGAAMWSLFFLVNVGRGQALEQLTPQEFEEVFAFLYDLSKRAPYAVRTTAAPHYRRYVLQQETRARRAERQAATGRPAGERPAARPWLAGLAGPRASRGVTDGMGMVFISHTGIVYPSGFLPLPAGDVRTTPLARIYREAPLFRLLRNRNLLEGKCGACEFRSICGGSRARAYAHTGNPMAEEPCCVYEPRDRGLAHASSSNRRRGLGPATTSRRATP
jgi:radical SAM protein